MQTGDCAVSGQVPEPTAHRRLLLRGLAVTGVAFAGSVLFGVGSAGANEAGETPADSGREGIATLTDGAASLGGGLLDLGESLLDSDASLLGLDSLAGIGEALDGELLNNGLDAATSSGPSTGTGEDTATAEAHSSGSDAKPRPDSETTRGTAGTGKAAQSGSESGGLSPDESGEAIESDPGLTGIADIVAPADEDGADLVTELADVVSEPGQATAGRLRAAGDELGDALRGTVGVVAPVVEVVGTVTDTALAPVVALVEPVVATVDPIIAPALAPVVTTVEPAVSSVLSLAAPLVDGLVPVTGTVAPVITAVRPVADLVSATETVAPVVGMLDDLAGDVGTARSAPAAFQVLVAAHPMIDDVESDTGSASETPHATPPMSGVESELLGSVPAAPSNPSAASGDLTVSVEFAGGDRPMPLPALTGLPGLSVGALSAAASADQPVPSSSALLPEEAVRHARFASAAARASSFDGQAQREANRPSVSPD